MTTGTAFLETVYTEELYRVASKPTIILTIPWNELKAEERERLVRITQVLQEKINPKLGLDAFTIVSAQGLDISDWIEKPERLIYFGPPVKGLNYYELIQAGGTNMVLSESLAELIGSDAARAKLWTALKELFAT